MVYCYVLDYEFRLFVYLFCSSSFSSSSSSSSSFLLLPLFFAFILFVLFYQSLFRFFFVLFSCYFISFFPRNFFFFQWIYSSHIFSPIYSALIGCWCTFFPPTKNFHRSIFHEGKLLERRILLRTLYFPSLTFFPILFSRQYSYIFYPYI